MPSEGVLREMDNIAQREMDYDRMVWLARKAAQKAIEDSIRRAMHDDPSDGDGRRSRMGDDEAEQRVRY